MLKRWKWLLWIGGVITLIGVLGGVYPLGDDGDPLHREAYTKRKLDAQAVAATVAACGALVMVGGIVGCELSRRSNRRP